MSVSCFSVSRSAVATVVFAAATFLWTAALPAQAPAGQDANVVDQARRLNEVAAQKLESEVRGAVREAERFTPSDPSKALDCLKKALAQVEDDTALSAKRRATVKRMLKDRIRVTEATVADAATQAKEQADKKAKGAEPRAEDEQRITDQDSMQRLRDGIKKLHKQSSSPAAQAAERTNSVANRLADNRQIQSARERRTNDVLRDVDKTSLPPKGDYDLPKDWKERTKNRGELTVVLRPKEKAILRALNAPISVRFKDSPLQDVIEYLQTSTGLALLLDKTALEAAGVTYDTPITLQVKGVTVRSLLRKILGDLGLTFIIKDEVVQVVTLEQAKADMVVRTYPIGDLVMPKNAHLIRNLFVERQIMLETVAQLIDLIQSTIDPQSWEANGGEGRIRFHEPTLSLVIKQSAEFHAVLAGGLR